MPAFTRKHYQAVAAIIAKHAPSRYDFVSEYSQGKCDTAESILEDIVAVFKEDNPLFKEDVFRKACGFTKKQ